MAFNYNEARAWAYRVALGILFADSETGKATDDQIVLAADTSRDIADRIQQAYQDGYNAGALTTMNRNRAGKGPESLLTGINEAHSKLDTPEI